MLTHSLKFWNICIFFFQKDGKKKIQLYFFISQEKFTFHSLNFSGGAYIKNKEESYIFSEMPFLTPFYVVFFFPEICIFFLVFFFPGKVYASLTHSFQTSVFFYFRCRKRKNTVFLLTHSIWSKISQKSTFPGK